MNFSGKSTPTQYAKFTLDKSTFAFWLTPKNASPTELGVTGKKLIPNQFSSTILQFLDKLVIKFSIVLESTLFFKKKIRLRNS